MQIIPAIVLCLCLTSFSLLAQFSQRYVSDSNLVFYKPSFSSDSSGNLVVVWPDMRHSRDHGTGEEVGAVIYGQLFDSGGYPVGENFRVSEPGLGKTNWFPVVSMNDNGDFVIAWQVNSKESEQKNVYAKVYNSDGIPFGSNFRVNDNSTTIPHFDPRIALLNSGKFAIAWMERRDGPILSYAQFYDSLGSPIGYNFKLNKDGVDGWISSIEVFPDERVMFLISKQYIVIYDKDFSLINEWIDTGIQGKMAIRDQNNVIIIYSDSDIENLYYRLYNLQSGSISDEISIDDIIPGYYIGDADVSVDEYGNMIFVWTDFRNWLPGIVGRGDIYAQRFDSFNNRIGNNFKLNHEDKELSQNLPLVNMLNNKIVTTYTEDLIYNMCSNNPPGTVTLNHLMKNIVLSLQEFDNPVEGPVYGWATIPPCKDSSNTMIDFQILKTYPNPFNKLTTISLRVFGNFVIQVYIYNNLGQLIEQVTTKEMDGNMSTGTLYDIPVRTDQLPSGTYYINVKSDFKTATTKVQLIR